MLTMIYYANIQNKQSWNQFYESENVPPKKYYAKDGSHKEFSGINELYVADSYFENVNYPNGGAIRFNANDENCQSLIESSIFIRCTSTGHGGAIDIHNGDFVMDKVCGNECDCQSSEGSFLYKLGSSNTITKLISSQISFCGVDAYATLYLNNGAHILTSLNLSHNICTYYSPLYSTTSIANDGYGLSMTLSSIMYNEADHTCIYLDSSYNNCINNTNIIGNSISSGCTCGLLCVYAITVFWHCTFLDNIAQNFIFISHSTITVYQTTLGSGQVKISGRFLMKDFPDTSIYNNLIFSPCVIITKPQKSILMWDLNHPDSLSNIKKKYPLII